MKYILFFALISLSVVANANTLYQQLCDFNPNWSKYNTRAPRQEAKQFSCDLELIQEHLYHVLKILKENNTAEFNAVQVLERRKNIERLMGYRLAGLFPKNQHKKLRTPVFIDKYGTHCAVGYLIQQSGHGLLAQQIANSKNLSWVKDLWSEELIVWQQNSGLTMEELKLIQGAYAFYDLNARYALNKYEKPQQPVVEEVLFEEKRIEDPAVSQVWLMGEGREGLLHGKWIQNYAPGIPWIEGYFTNGLRSGAWKEYYQGTNILCRTEHWENDTLNGIRTRFDREGRIIEKIQFKNGVAVLKVNTDRDQGLIFYRRPLEDNHLKTTVSNLYGVLLAEGQEVIHNSSGRLQWFQDIELTALNTMIMDNRDGLGSGFSLGNAIHPFAGDFHSRFQPSTPLVEYTKVGEWKYYAQNPVLHLDMEDNPVLSSLKSRFPLFAHEIFSAFDESFPTQENLAGDLLKVNYELGKVTDIKTYGALTYIHLEGAEVRLNKAINNDSVLFDFNEEVLEMKTIYGLMNSKFQEKSEIKITDWKPSQKPTQPKPLFIRKRIDLFEREEWS